MTTGGDQVLAVAFTQVGVTEYPPGSNIVVYNEGWGYSAWCATFVSWCHTQAGYPLPAINGPQGFSYCPSGQQWGYFYDGSNVTPQAGDCLIFSWEPWHMEGGQAICSSGVYAGAPAGDHTGFFVADIGGGYYETLEGNTSQSSWDNGGAVMVRTDRYSGQICCYWRPAVIAGGSSAPPEPSKPTFPLTELSMFLLSGPTGVALCGAGYFKGLDAEEYSQVAGIPGIATFECGGNQRAFDLITAACMNGSGATDDNARPHPRVRLIDCKGALWFTDFVHVFHAYTPEIVTHFNNLGWLDNDRDGAGNPIAQGVPDDAFDNMVQID